MYGENGAQLRTQLAALLRQHRIQHTLGGATAHNAATSTAAQREQYGNTVRRYRQAVLAWCAEAVITARPVAFSNLQATTTDPFHDPPREGSPLTQLAHAIGAAAAGSTSGLPSLDELTTPHDNETVEHWRLAARAAALAEHDTNGPTIHGRLSTPQAQALLGDVAAVVQALVVLDQRYSNTPGWEFLQGSSRLGWAALACALDVGLGQPDYSVDEIGWRPRVKPIRGPAKPGITGVLQAEHNLLVHLQTPPNATNLRLVVDSQRLLSHQLSSLADIVAPDLAQRWATRVRTYTLIQQQLRDIAGQVGRGASAAAEGANAVTRLRRLPCDTVIEPRILAGFDALFRRMDERLADIIEDGLYRGTLFQRTTLPRLVDDTRDLVNPVRERYVALTTPSDTAVLQMVRQRLRPPIPLSEPRARPDRTRAELQFGLVHRPPGRTAATTEVPHL